MKCLSKPCDYLANSSIKIDKGLYCCKICKQFDGLGHGSLCEKKFLKTNYCKIIEPSDENKTNVLMLVAHPDDEALFGFSDLLNNNNCTVLCLTNLENHIRRTEFFKSMEITNSKGYMLNYPDIKNDKYYYWGIFDTEHFVKSILNVIDFNYKFDIVVSHGEDGESQHHHHIKIHHVAKHIASLMNLPFYDFRSRFDNTFYTDPELNKKYESLIACYTSQPSAINGMKYFFSGKSVFETTRASRVV